MATQVLSSISQSENQRYTLDMKRKAEMDMAHGLEVARQEGIEIVRAEEREIDRAREREIVTQVKLSAVKNALEMGFSLEQASKLADLPISEIEAFVAIK